MGFVSRAVSAIFTSSLMFTAAQAQDAAAPDAPTTAWTTFCAPVQGDQPLRCELRQRVANDQGQEIARIAFGPAGEQGRELAIRTPQGVLLTAPVELAPLEAEAQIRVPYRTCLNQVCIARVLVEDETLTLLSEATQPAIRFRDRSGRQIRIIVSLEGLTEGLAALDAR